MRKKWLPLTLCLTLLTFPSKGAVVRNIAAPSTSAYSHYDHSLAVVTYNIRGCRTDSGNADPALIAMALGSLDADLIALQEVDRDPLHEGNYTLRTLKNTRVEKEIDRILLSPDFAFLDASAPAIGPSDHYPVQMMLKRSNIKEAISSN